MDIDKATQGTDRSFEDYEWVEHLGWNKRLPKIIRYINDFLVYRRFCKHATQEEIYELHQIQDEYDLNFALEKMIIKVKCKRSYAFMDKEKFIKDQINKPQVDINQLDEAFAEEERWKHLTPEQRRRKQNPVPKIQGVCAPILLISELIAEPIIEKHLSNDGVGYIVHDKLFGMYTAAIVSPMRIKADGTYMVEKVVRRPRICYLDVPAQEEVSAERQKYMNWLNQGNSAKPKPNNNINMDNINIDHVKKAIGLQNKTNNNLNGDIF